MDNKESKEAAEKAKIKEKWKALQTDVAKCEQTAQLYVNCELFESRMKMLRRVKQN